MITLDHIAPSFFLACSDRSDDSMNESKLSDWVSVHFPRKHLAFAMLEHGIKRKAVEYIKKPTNFNADALLSNDSNIVLGMTVGDCLPIVVLDEVSGGFMLIHGGWKTLFFNILPLSLQEFQLRYHTDLKHAKVWIGPSIQSCCNVFQTVDVFSLTPGWKKYIEKRKEGYHVNLQKYVVDIALSFGIPSGNIVNEGSCTYHEDKKYFSHRRAVQKSTPEDDGRMGVLVWKTS